MAKIHNVLTIAGSDSGGGAGIQADIKTFSALGVYGLSVVTAVTAQNTQGVLAVETISSEVVEKQLKAVFDDINIGAVKIGMLSQTALIKVVAQQLRHYKPKWLVLDPVMIATSGDRLLDDEAIEILKTTLLPLATIITPNLHEAAALLVGKAIQTESDMLNAAQQLSDQYGCSVLLKGGHVEDLNESNDLLYSVGNFEWLKGTRIATQNTHGTGCTLSAAIAAHLAKGELLVNAVKQAKQYIQQAIEHADELNVGKGKGPVKHQIS